MNTGDFEQQLRRQALRPIPVEWRGDILAACVPERSAVAVGSMTGWRWIFARFPMAWGALAAIWVGVIAINACISGLGQAGSGRRTIGFATEPLSVLSLQSTELRQLASGDESISAETPASQPAATPRNLRTPRSDRRKDRGWGEFSTQETLGVFA